MATIDSFVQIQRSYLSTKVNGDTPWGTQTGLQDPAAIFMEGLFAFNGKLLPVIAAIIVLTAWIILTVLQLNKEVLRSNVSAFSHSNVVEVVWTTTPALVLLSLAIPSFSLLYSMDEVASPELSLKILGHQWYWTYEISDFLSCSKGKNLKYSAYLLSPEFLKQNPIGIFRNLETNRRLVLPANSHLRLLVTAVDVLHSWTIPSFGIKIDGCPGRVNQANLFIKRFGVFFGQCSEICGVNHGFMPIAVVAVSNSQFEFLAYSRLK